MSRSLRSRPPASISNSSDAINIDIDKYQDGGEITSAFCSTNNVRSGTNTTEPSLSIEKHDLSVSQLSITSRAAFRNIEISKDTERNDKQSKCQEAVEQLVQTQSTTRRCDSGSGADLTSARGSTVQREGNCRSAIGEELASAKPSSFIASSPKKGPALLSPSRRRPSLLPSASFTSSSSSSSSSCSLITSTTSSTSTCPGPRTPHPSHNTAQAISCQATESGAAYAGLPRSQSAQTPSLCHKTSLSKGLQQEEEEGEHHHTMLLLPPQPAFLGRRSSSSSDRGYKANNASTTSFASSMGCDDDILTPPHSGRDSDASSWEHAHSNAYGDVGAAATKEAMLAGAAVGQGGGRNGKQGSSFEGKARATAKEMKGGSNGGGFKSLGKRLFNRSAVVARSESQSSAQSAQSSPPLTPTTPPRLPAFQKGIDGLPMLPSLSITSRAQQESHSFTGSMLQQRGQIASSTSSASTASSIPALSYESSATATSKSSFGLPLPPPATAAASRAKRAPMTTMTERGESPTRATMSLSPPPPSSSSSPPPPPSQQQQAIVTAEPEEDSDFLRAVLNFGLADEAQDNLPALPTRSSSRFDFGSDSSGATMSRSTLSSPFALGTLPSWTARRQGEAPKRLTEAEVRALAEEERQAKSSQPYGYGGSFSQRRQQYRAGLFGRTKAHHQEDDSEDEYGSDGEEGGSRSAGPNGKVVAEGTKSFPSSFAKGEKRHSGSSLSNGGDHHHTSSPVKSSSTTTPSGSGGLGLDTGAKKATYICTLLKVHPQLASCVKVTPNGKLAPGAARISEAFDNASARDIRFPRSIHRRMHLEGHSSTTSFTRDLRVAVHRSHVMKKLKRTALTVHDEVELGWFVTRYGSQLISPEEIAARLAQRPAASPEALMRPPMAVPPSSTTSLLPATTPSTPLVRRDSLGSIMGDNLVEHNGMALWSSRPGFVDRTVVIVAEDEYQPGEIVLPLADMSFTVGKRADFMSAAASSPAPVRNETMKRIAKPAPITFTKRTKVLAGLAPAIELGTSKTRGTEPARRRERPPRQSTMPTSTSNVGLPRDRSIAPWMASSRPPQPWRSSTMPVPYSQQSRGAADVQAPDVIPVSTSAAMLSSEEASERAAALRKLSGSKSPPLVQRRSSSDSMMAPSNLTSRRGVRAAASYNDGRVIAEEDEREALSDEEEEVPLAMLRSHRAERSAERERVAQLEAEVHQLREREREMEAAMRREMERKRAEKLLEERKRALAEARTRRAKTEHSTLLASPTYGAGSPLAASPNGPGMARKSSTTYLEMPNSPTGLSKRQSSKHLSVLPSPSTNDPRSSQMPSPRMSSHASVAFLQHPHQLMNSTSVGNLRQGPTSSGSALGLGGMDPRASAMIHPQQLQQFHHMQQQQQQQQQAMQVSTSSRPAQTLLAQHEQLMMMQQQQQQHRQMLQQQQQQQQQQMMMMSTPHLHHSMSMANMRPNPQPLVQLGPGQIPLSATQHRLGPSRQ